MLHFGTTKLAGTSLCPVFSIQSFKPHISTADRAMFNLDTHCGTFSLLDEKNLHLMGHCFRICPLKFIKHELHCVMVTYICLITSCHILFLTPGNQCHTWVLKHEKQYTVFIILSNSWPSESLLRYKI